MGVLNPFRNRGKRTTAAAAQGQILAAWQNQTNSGVFSVENPSVLSFPDVGGERLARWSATTSGGDNAAIAYMYYDVPSARMQGGNVLHLAWEMRVPSATYTAITTNFGAPFQQIKFHLSRAETNAQKWAGQSYRYAVTAMGVATQGESGANRIRTLNDWFNHAYVPSKDSGVLGPDTWMKVQLAYREDATNGYVRTWYNGVEVGSESVSNDNTSDGGGVPGNNNNGGSEGLALNYRMRFGLAYTATNTSGVNVSMDIRKIVISTAFQAGF